MYCHSFGTAEAVPWYEPSTNCRALPLVGMTNLFPNKTLLVRGDALGPSAIIEKCISGQNQRQSLGDGALVEKQAAVEIEVVVDHAAGWEAGAGTLVGEVAVGAAEVTVFAETAEGFG